MQLDANLFVRRFVSLNYRALYAINCLQIMFRNAVKAIDTKLSRVRNRRLIINKLLLILQFKYYSLNDCLATVAN